MSIVKVLDMTCKHCEMTIKKEFFKTHPEIKLDINLEDKTIKIEDDSQDKVVTLLKELGYTPELMK